MLILTLTTAALAGNTTSAAKSRERAEQLEAKAQAHEANAQEMATSNSYQLLRHKWPSMLQGKINREKQLAEKARLAASEARKAAD